MKKTYNVEVDCANCAAKMEEAVEGVYAGCITIADVGVMVIAVLNATRALRIRL